MMAGLDGIKNRIEPHEPVDKDLYELPPEEAKNIPQVPNSLLDSLEALVPTTSSSSRAACSRPS
jgi:glutamine synthetase